MSERKAAFVQLGVTLAIMYLLVLAARTFAWLTWIGLAFSGAGVDHRGVANRDGLNAPVGRAHLAGCVTCDLEKQASR